MLKSKTLFIFVAIALIFSYFNIAKAASLAERLRGYILLQVQSHGEAWYVIPTESKRVYLANGQVAYNVMSKLGLGITNSDLNKIPVGLESRFAETDSDGDGLGDKLEEGLKTDPYDTDSDNDGYDDYDEVSHDYSPLGKTKNVYDQNLVNRLRGKILLQVQERGQAWYVHPVNGRRYYMKDGESAYEIMRYLSLGITNQDLSNIPISTTNFGGNDNTPTPPTTPPSTPPSAPPTSTPPLSLDTQAPSRPSNLSATSTAQQITLNWTNSTDNRGVAGYNVYRSLSSGTNFVKINNIQTNQYIDSALNPSTTYYYVVRAYDAAGNISATSTQAQARTYAQSQTNPPIAPDTQVPTTPANLVATGGTGQVSLSWGVSSDNIGVTQYRLERANSASTVFSAIGTSTSNSYADTSLDANTNYYYRVRAQDAAGNLSEYSNTANASTLSVADPAQYVAVLQSYVDKVTVGNLTAPENTAYTWYRNSAVVNSGVSPTTFLAHFDGSLLTSNDESPLAQDNISYASAKFGQGMRGEAEYPVVNNLDFNEGTIEFWLTLDQDLHSSVYNNNQYIFRYINSTNYQKIMMNVKTQEGILVFTVHSGSADPSWADAVQISTSYNDILPGQPIFLAMSYSKSQNKSSLYLNGWKIAQSDFNGFNFGAANSNLVIGNNYATIDEFRILNKQLNDEEIKYNYERGTPFASNEVYYSGVRNVNDSLQLSTTLQGNTYTANAVVRSAKLQSISPAGYVLSNRNNINLTFNTASAATCRYGSSADNYSDLPNLVSGSGTSHSINYTVSSVVNSHNFYIKCQSNSSDGDDYAWYRRFRVLPNINNSWPKIGLIVWGNNVSSSEVNTISKYDLVSLAKDNIANSGLLQNIKRLNPGVILLPYINAPDNNITYGINSFVHYDFYEKLSDSWRLRNTQGQYITNLYYPNVMNYNLLSSLPWAETLSEHIEDEILSRGDWDGVWFDVADTSFWWIYDYGINRFVQYPDFDLDGVNEDLNVSADLVKARSIWRDGLAQIMSLTRSVMGSDGVIIGNNSDANPQLYNGKMWERFLYYHNSTTLTDNLSNFLSAANSNSFLYWNFNTASPHLNWNLFELNNAADYQNHRLGLVASLLGGVYYNPVSSGQYREFRWYDEYWINWDTGEVTTDPSGRGYLGAPVTDAYQVEPNVWERDFQHGIVLLNNNATSTVTINLPLEFRYISGRQDSVANPGGATQTVSIKPRDARILLTTKNNDPLIGPLNK